MEAFVGIDLAFAKRKPLPICICILDKRRLTPLSTQRACLPHIPRGSGNRGSIDPNIVEAFANEVAEYLQAVEKHLQLRIRRIAIDAPSAPRAESRVRRRAEEALDCCRISCFTTPSASEFDRKRCEVDKHLKNGGAENRIPYANQLWMLVGFALFERLEKEWECLEVYPQATMKVLGVGSIHKSKSEGVRQQFRAVAERTGWPEPSANYQPSLIREFVRGPLHDGVDAYTCAWIASLADEDRTPLGQPPNDVIWVPNTLPGTVRAS
jgi:predicted nuclease with RNAse H fold